MLKSDTCNDICNYKRCKTWVALTCVLTMNLKRVLTPRLKKMGVTPSEALRLMLEYIADNERLPFKQTLLSDEDAELVEIVKERLRNP